MFWSGNKLFGKIGPKLSKLLQAVTLSKKIHYSILLKLIND